MQKDTPRFVGAALILLVLFLLLPPWRPSMPAAGLDPSWTALLTHAFIHQWQFGTDLVLTYGPFGFLSTDLFDPRTYAVLLGFWLVLAAAIAGGIVGLVQGLRRIDAIAIAILIVVGLRIAIVSRDTVNGHLFNDAVFFALPLLAIFLAFNPASSRRSRRLVAPLVALAALSCLIKFSFAILAAPLVLLIDVERMWRGRFLPLYSLLGFGAVVLFFRLAGQSLSHLPAYVLTSLTIASGYSEAMQIPGNSFELTRFLASAGCVLLLVGYGEWQYGGWRGGDRSGPTLLLAFALFIFVGFKAGFVRHDIHSLIAWSALACGSAVYASRYCRIVPGAGRRAGMLGLCVFITYLALTNRQSRTAESLAGFLDANFGRGLLDRGAAAGRVLSGSEWPRLNDDSQRARAAIAAAHPLPQLAGTVDIYPWDIAVVLAHDLDYRPRPVYQSYAAYDGELMALNRAHLESSRAAATLLFDLETIDNRLPQLDEGRQWPDILAHYDAAETPPGRYLILRRRTAPRRVELQRVGDIGLTWWTPLALPAAPAFLWAAIEIDQTPLGRATNAAFKLPPIELALRLSDGSERVFRLVPGMAREGFLLSPLVDTPARFAQLLRQDMALVTSRRVTHVQLRGPADVSAYYRGAIRVRLQSLSFDPAAADGGIPRNAATSTTASR